MPRTRHEEISDLYMREAAEIYADYHHKLRLAFQKAYLDGYKDALVCVRRDNQQNLHEPVDEGFP